MEKEWVLITGSSKGLGRELALVFTENNYNIILNGRDANDLNKIKEDILKAGGECVIAAGDIRENEVIENLADMSRKKNISILINNAGSQLSALKLPINEFSGEQIDELINVHLTAPIKLTNKIYSFLKKKGFGAIININSLSGLESQEGRSIYCGSKWGLRGFTNTLRLEAEKNNIFIMGVYASRIKTRPEFSAYGWEPREAAQKIYICFNDRINDLMLDGRPEEFKKK